MNAIDRADAVTRVVVRVAGIGAFFWGLWELRQWLRGGGDKVAPEGSLEKGPPGGMTRGDDAVVGEVTGTVFGKPKGK